MTDPLTAIEDRAAQIDIGRLAYRIYQGAREEGATKTEAIAVAYAWFLASIRSGTEDVS